MSARKLEAPTMFNAVVALVVTAFILAPIAIVVPMSFTAAQSFEFPPASYSLSHYRTYLTSEDWLLPTLNSFVIGVASSLLTLAVTTPAAFAINRRDFPGRRLLQIVLLLPMLVPSIVMAISYFSVFSLIGLNQTYLGIVLAHCCISIPVVMIAMSASLRNLDRNIERAALICGAKPMQVFTHITLPLLRPAFLVAGFFAFFHSFDEATISLFISGREVSTLPLRIFTSIQLEADPVVAVVSSLLIGVAILVMAAGAFFRRRDLLADAR